MRWFIRGKEGTYYAGGEAENEYWSLLRKGAVAFRSREDAQARIDELGLEDAEPEEH